MKLFSLHEITSVPYEEDSIMPIFIKKSENHECIHFRTVRFCFLYYLSNFL